MTRLSKNFKREEFACFCGCGFDTVDAELLTVLQRVSDHYGRAVIIRAGNRCPWKNKRTEGAANKSYHVKAKAADFEVKGIPAYDVYCLLNKWYPKKYGIGNYSDRNHIDVRRSRQRWFVK